MCSLETKFIGISNRRSFILLIVHQYEHCYSCLKITVITSFTVVAVLFIHKNTVISNTISANILQSIQYLQIPSSGFYTQVLEASFTEMLCIAYNIRKKIHLQVLKSLPKLRQPGIFQGFSQPRLYLHSVYKRILVFSLPPTDPKHASLFVRQTPEFISQVL